VLVRLLIPLALVVAVLFAAARAPAHRTSCVASARTLASVCHR